MIVWRRSWNRSPGRPAASLSARQAVSHFLVAFVGSISAPLTCRPQIMVRRLMPELIRALDHSRQRAHRGCVQRDDAVACHVLAPSYGQGLCEQIDIGTAQMFYFHRP